MISLIRDYLVKIIKDIDAGNSNVNEEEAIELVDLLKRLTNRERRLSKYQSCEYLNVSRATFDNYVRDGKIPQGESVAGFKEKSWSRKDLDTFINKNKKK